MNYVCLLRGINVGGNSKVSMKELKSILEAHGYKKVLTYINSGNLMPIFMNNMRVLLFTILFAFFYGAGAIFIFAWNASVIGFAIGNVFRNKLANAVYTLSKKSFWSRLAHCK